MADPVYSPANDKKRWTGQLRAAVHAAGKDSALISPETEVEGRKMKVVCKSRLAEGCASVNTWWGSILQREREIEAHRSSRSGTDRPTPTQ